MLFKFFLKIFIYIKIKGIKMIEIYMYFYKINDKNNKIFYLS